MRPRPSASPPSQVLSFRRLVANSLVCAVAGHCLTTLLQLSLPAGKDPVVSLRVKQVKELVLYAISEEYFEVRNQLGLSIVG